MKKKRPGFSNKTMNTKLLVKKKNSRNVSYYYLKSYVKENQFTSREKVHGQEFSKRVQGAEPWRGQNCFWRANNIFREREMEKFA